MNKSTISSERVAQQVRKNLDAIVAKDKGITAAIARNAARRAFKGTRLVGGGASNLAREAAKGAVQAVGEVGGESQAFIKETIIGVFEGTGKVVRITTPAVKEAVAGAIKESKRISDDLEDSGKKAVEGAIVGAASAGVDARDAAVAAAKGAVEAVIEVGGDLSDAAKAAVGGVVSGVAATGGDAAQAAKDTVHSLISNAVDEERPAEEIAEVAEEAVDAALEEAEDKNLERQRIAVAVATGAVGAAYLADKSHGDKVKQSVLNRMLKSGLVVGPELERRLSALGASLSEELPKGRTTWRWMAFVRAGRLLLSVGGIDLAGSLAYFTIMSLLPLAALVLTAAAFFGDPKVVSDQITNLFVYYFPASADLVRESVEGLVNQSLVIGAFALIGLIMGANGLFLAANRSIHRIFDIKPRGALKLTVAEIILATILASLFLASLGLTALHQVLISAGEALMPGGGTLSTLSVVILSIVSTALPLAFTTAMFAIVYYRLPNVEVRWRDAVFGAFVAIVLFEFSKHLFFWFTNLSSQRNAVYGPIASVVIMMTWAYIASMIFLYGAALTRAAGELRPGRSTTSDQVNGVRE